MGYPDGYDDDSLNAKDEDISEVLFENELSGLAAGREVTPEDASCHDDDNQGENPQDELEGVEEEETEE